MIKIFEEFAAQPVSISFKLNDIWKNIVKEPDITSDG